MKPVDESNIQRSENLSVYLTSVARNDIIEIQDLIEAKNEGSMIENEAYVTKIESLLSDARVHRGQAVLLALTSDRNPTKSSVEPQSFTAGRADRRLDPSLEEVYQVTGLVEALSRGQVTLQDFRGACVILQEAHTPSAPQETSPKGVYTKEMINLVAELSTYQQAVDQLLLSK